MTAPLDPAVPDELVQKMNDLLWKFGVWDDLTHEQHIELTEFVRQYARQEVKAAIEKAHKPDLRAITKATGDGGRWRAYKEVLNYLTTHNNHQLIVWLERRLAIMEAHLTPPPTNGEETAT